MGCAESWESPRLTWAWASKCYIYVGNNQYFDCGNTGMLSIQALSVSLGLKLLYPEIKYAKFFNSNWLYETYVKNGKHLSPYYLYLSIKNFSFEYMLYSVDIHFHGGRPGDLRCNCWIHSSSSELYTQSDLCSNFSLHGLKSSAVWMINVNQHLLLLLWGGAQVKP